MKIKFIQIILTSLIGVSSQAQLLVPGIKPTRSIIDPAMIIQFGGQKLEILPNLRAIRKDLNTYTILNANVSEAISKENLGVAYSYAIKSNILLNGEISIKLRDGYTASALTAISTNAKILISPDIYIITASTPQDLVKWVNLLQTLPSVQWIEPFTIKARLE